LSIPFPKLFGIAGLVGTPLFPDVHQKMPVMVKP